MSGGRRYRWCITGLLLLAAVLRFHALFANTFHADEALFATFARLIATWRDPLLQTQFVDKPPLLFYLQALFYPLLGPVAWAARLPNLIASLLLVPLTGRLVIHLYRDQLAAVLAAGLVALSPFTIQFSATAFTDPLLVTLLVASLVAATRPAELRIPYSVLKRDTQHAIRNTHHASRITHHALPGLLFALAVATKYQAWLFLPLLLGLLTFRPKSKIQNPKSKISLQSPIANLLLAIIPILLAVFLWEWVRTGRFSLWQSQITGYGGLRLAWSWELWPRLNQWGALWNYLLGSSVLAFALLLAMPPFLALLIYEQDRPTALDQFFLLFLLGYFLLHWFVAVPVWDRYVLPAVPIAALLLGRFASRLLAFAAPHLLGDLANRPTTPARFLPYVVAAVLLLAQLPPAFQARLGRFPVGGQPSADSGAAKVAALLAHAPYSTVLYDHWYSWQWRYYLLDSGVYVSWFPHPAALARDLAVFGGNNQPRYLALPDTPAARPVLRAVTEAGFEARQVYTAEGGITLYQLVPQ